MNKFEFHWAEKREIKQPPRGKLIRKAKMSMEFLDENGRVWQYRNGQWIYLFFTVAEG